MTGPVLDTPDPCVRRHTSTPALGAAPLVAEPVAVVAVGAVGGGDSGAGWLAVSLVVVAVSWTLCAAGSRRASQPSPIPSRRPAEPEPADQPSASPRDVRLRLTAVSL